MFNQFMGAARSTMIDDLDGDNFDHTGLGFIGGGWVGAASSGARPIDSNPVPSGTPRWGAAWKRAVSHYYNRSFGITCHGSCQSYRTNYLDLDPTYRDAYGLPLLRMTFDFHDNEYKMSDYMTKKAVEIARPRARRNSTPIRAGEIQHRPATRAPQHGGAVMGADPATSAVNKYLQSWDVPNLFVIGARRLPAEWRLNPTGTVGALTFQALDAIKTRYLKRPGALA